MTKKNKIESPFSNNGCLSAATINNYLSGRLNDEENEYVKKHINECVFCADAVEGFRNIKLKDSLVKTVGQLDREIDKKSETGDHKILFLNRKVLAYSSLAASILIISGLFLLISNNWLRQDKIVSENLSSKKENQLKPGQGQQEKNKEPGSLPEEKAVPVIHVPAAESHDKAEMTDIKELKSVADVAGSELVTDIPESEKSVNLEAPQPKTDNIVTVYRGTKSTGTGAVSEAEKNKTLKFEAVRGRDTKKSAEKAYLQPEEILPVSMQNEDTLYYETTVYAGADELPIFGNDGIEQFKKYLQKNLKYPEEAKKLKIEGEVLINFTVDDAGRVIDPKIVSGVDSLLNTEALRIVSSSPLWIPGKKNGQPVKITYTVPVIFKIK